MVAKPPLFSRLNAPLKTPTLGSSRSNRELEMPPRKIMTSSLSVNQRGSPSAAKSMSGARPGSFVHGGFGAPGDETGDLLTEGGGAGLEPGPRAQGEDLAPELARRLEGELEDRSLAGGVEPLAEVERAAREALARDRRPRRGIDDRGQLVDHAALAAQVVRRHRGAADEHWPPASSTSSVTPPTVVTSPARSSAAASSAPGITWAVRTRWRRPRLSSSKSRVTSRVGMRPKASSVGASTVRSPISASGPRRPETPRAASRASVCRGSRAARAPRRRRGEPRVRRRSIAGGGDREDRREGEVEHDRGWGGAPHERLHPLNRRRAAAGRAPRREGPVAAGQVRRTVARPAPGEPRSGPRGARPAQDSRNSRSSEPRSARLVLAPPRTAAARSRFFSCSSRTRSSIVSFAMMR